MALPVVAIVGRPNVGKSSLLNMLAGRRISIVDPTAGVTRDRISVVLQHKDRYFELVDTGGYGIVDRDDLDADVEQQIRFAVDQASLILFVVDARDGLLPLDQAVAKWLRASNKPVVLLANKVDAIETRTEIGEFHKLGFGSPMEVSATHRRGEDELRERIHEHLCGLAVDEVPADPVMKLAIVGRRNVGKSTMINAMAGQPRVIVSEVAGTTRDSVDVRFERDGRTYVAIDTAGLRKKAKIADDIEFYSTHRTELSIRRADVVLFLIDATADVGVVDKKLGRYIVDQYKPCIVVVNKWDLAKDRASSDDYGEYLSKTLVGLDYAPIAFTTAKDGKNVQSVIDLASELFKQSRTRVSTGELNRVLKEAVTQNMPKPKHGAGGLKVLYATQVAVCPPTLVLFVSDPTRVTPAIERFFINRLREQLPFSEVPIRLVIRGRSGYRRAN
ncbi:MAG TPA: ribosome biogenesis GTPase Der, partial [Phycisphaerae bacterium]|nr:ribosome biogenesis GTPase Der [Phycisphaerae bacterium]